MNDVARAAANTRTAADTCATAGFGLSRFRLPRLRAGPSHRTAYSPARDPRVATFTALQKDEPRVRSEPAIIDGAPVQEASARQRHQRPLDSPHAAASATSGRAHGDGGGPRHSRRNLQDGT